MPTDAASRATDILRDGSHFGWHVIPLLLLVLYVYANEIELWLNRIGALTWDNWWWNARAPWLIFVVGYLWFFVIAFWVHDLPTIRQKVRVVLALFAVDAAALALFGGVLGWI